MAFDSSANGRHRRAELKYKTGVASKRQIAACGGEFSHFETIGDKTYEVYRLANGQTFRTATTEQAEALKRSNSLAFFPTKEERERRKAEREKFLREHEEKRQLEEEQQAPQTTEGEVLASTQEESTYTPRER